jgi:serine protease inhibitor
MIQIGSNENLYVSKVIQKAFIEVNEEGAEAAASTGFIGITKKCRRLPINVIANHPFMILLGESRNTYFTTLFYGKVNKPDSGDSQSTPAVIIEMPTLSMKRVDDV